MQLPAGEPVTQVVIHVPPSFTAHMSQFEVWLGRAAGDVSPPSAAVCTRAGDSTEHSSYSYGDATKPSNHVFTRLCGGVSGPDAQQQWITIAQRGFVILSEVQIMTSRY